MPSKDLKSELNELLERYLLGEATAAEEAFIDKYYTFFEQKDNYSEGLPEAELQELKTRMLANIREEIEKPIPIERPQRPAKLRRLFRLAAAAAIIICMIGLLLYQKRKVVNKDPETLATRAPREYSDLPAGMDGAVLTLADGRQISVDSSKNGELARDGQGNISKKGGVLVIEAGSPGSPGGQALAQLNTLSTPRGRQCQVLLPDGSKVWVNAESSIRFPDAFTGGKREVEMKGEAYFEIAKDASKPFIVKVNESYIQVLGTSFNVMAYANESSTRTTLLEGAVSFNHAGNSVKLSPGEQCELHRDGKIRTIDDADVEFATAWKNGRQIFRNADIRSIMRQVERWYDLDVVYEGPVATGTFSGNIPRTANLSQVLKMLELSDIHFELDPSNKKLIVKP